MIYHILKLNPGQDLKLELKNLIKSKNLKNGVILSCVGSLKKINLRLADENSLESVENFEIVSLVGTLSTNGTHVHVALSNNAGKTIGGHLKNGCIIHTTAEIIIGEIPNIIFEKKFDPNTGFKELNITK